MKFLHISTDNRFVNSAPTAFEKVAEGQNEYWIIHEGKPAIARVPITKLIAPCDVSDMNLAKELDDYDIVFLHSLIPEFYPLINNANNRVKFVWLGWGFDYYDLLQKKLTLPQTTKLCGGQWRYRLRELKKRFVTKSYKKKTSLFSKIKYFCPVLPQEYEMLKNKCDSLPDYFEWNYGALNPDLIPVDHMDARVNGENILVGNSAHPSNNHVELFGLLKNIDTQDRDIIIPLSYGEDDYREKILPLINNNMEPITDFIERYSYMDIMQSCSIVLMNHRRQQAFGTIVIMLHMGAKLYLRSENPLYQRLKEWGVTVFAIEDLARDQSGFFTPITNKQAKKNRQAVADYYSLDHYCKRTKALIEKVIYDR
jgi:dTDP-N-acetylfucosamine:lipid II N-acetylfucosaminyltransferase